MPKPWPNGLTQPDILDDPLDRPEVQLASARDLLDEASRRINSALNLHPRQLNVVGHAYCGYCVAENWPCPTVGALTS